MDIKTSLLLQISKVLSFDATEITSSLRMTMPITSSKQEFSAQTPLVSLLRNTRLICNSARSKISCFPTGYPTSKDGVPVSGRHSRNVERLLCAILRLVRFHRLSLNLIKP